MFRTTSHPEARFTALPQVKDKAGVAHGTTPEGGGRHTVFAQEALNSHDQWSVYAHGWFLLSRQAQGESPVCLLTAR